VTARPAAIFGFDNLTAVGTSPIGVTGDTGIETFGIVTGRRTRPATCDLHAEGRLGRHRRQQHPGGRDERRPPGELSVQVYNNGVQVEAWGNLTKDQASRFYVETFMALVSDYIRVTDNTATRPPAGDGTYTLTGGQGRHPVRPGRQDALLIGNPIWASPASTP
jgi:hypothetical protein